MNSQNPPKETDLFKKEGLAAGGTSSVIGNGGDHGVIQA
jgi:hypothetical protein